MRIYDRAGCRHRRMAAFLGAFALFSCIIDPAAVVLADRSNSLMDITADGRLLACANRDSGTVTVVDLGSHRKLREIPVGRKPEGLTFIGETHTLAVAIYAEDRVAFVDGETGATLGVTDVVDEPYGIVSDGAGAKVYVTLQ